MPFTLRNLKEDLEDVGSNFDGAPDLEFRLATNALELEKSGLSVPPTNRWRAGATRAGAWRAQESTRRLLDQERHRCAACRRVHRRREPRLGLQRPAPDGPRSTGFFFTRARLAALPSAPRRVCETTSETRCAYPRSCARRSAAARAWSTSEVVRRAIEPPTQR